MGLKTPAAAVAATTAVLLLAGCGTGSITHGRITGKHYEAARSHSEMLPVYGSRCSTSRKTTTCRTVIVAWVPHTSLTPECYRLDLRSGNQTGSVCVSPTEYDRAEPGSQW